ncbi:MAG: CoA transferase [Betaproteobacteria bacterium]|nr:CoA transferase [Betaproteobacteria bacterium]
MDKESSETVNAPPLSGIKVIEIGVAMAGPFCAMLLADYGADVVKVERAGEGDESRHWSPFFPGGVSHYFAAANRNKRSLAIDLKSVDGIEVLLRLAADADVLIDNYRPGDASVALPYRGGPPVPYPFTEATR